MSEDPSTPRAPDLSPDVVQSHMARTAEHSSYATKQWEKMLENSARQQGDLGFQAFNSAVPDPLKRVDSMLEQSVGAPDTTVAGILTGVGSVMLSATGPQIPAAGELADRRRMVVAVRSQLLRPKLSLRSPG